MTWPRRSLFLITNMLGILILTSVVRHRTSFPWTQSGSRSWATSTRLTGCILGPLRTCTVPTRVVGWPELSETCPVLHKKDPFLGTVLSSIEESLEVELPGLWERSQPPTSSEGLFTQFHGLRPTMISVQIPLLTQNMKASTRT